MPIDLRNPGRTIHVGVILVDALTEALDVVPIDLLHGISTAFMEHMNILPEQLRAQALDIEFHWVNEKGTPARLTAGMMVQTTDSFATCPPLDIVLMGAHHGNYTPNEAELAFVRKSYEDSSAFLSICAGMMVFLQAGVLDGKTATGPQPFLSILKEKHPETNWVEKRYVRDGKIWTSGALLNGLDLMKAFVTETFGGPGTLAEAIIEIGAWPKRDVEYKGGE